MEDKIEFQLGLGSDEKSTKESRSRSMAYNTGLEDPQNWPFSVRYTASPYRKSKFPVETNAEIQTTTSSTSGHHQHQQHHQSPFVNNTLIQTQMQNPWIHNTSGPGVPYMNMPNVNVPFQYHLNNNANGKNHSSATLNSNATTTATPIINYNNHFYHQHLQHQYQQHLHLQQQFQHYQAPPDHHHYGLPPNVHNGRFLIRNPMQQCQYSLNRAGIRAGEASFNGNRVDGVSLDEGYIEDLKQPCSSNISNSNSNGHGHHHLVNGRSNSNSFEYDPYSYVYDSKLQDDLPSPSILERLRRESATNSKSNSSQPPKSPSRSMKLQSQNYRATATRTGGGVGIPGLGLPIEFQMMQSSRNGHVSENEYEEIRDVARYMTEAAEEQSRGGPIHFKSFSSTDDILAEVVQVQQRHDRVLDQLNLDVENLLIRSSAAEIENGGSASTNANIKCDNSNSNSLKDFNSYVDHCYCNLIQQPQPQGQQLPGMTMMAMAAPNLKGADESGSASLGLVDSCCTTTMAKTKTSDDFHSCECVDAEMKKGSGGGNFNKNLTCVYCSSTNSTASGAGPGLGTIKILTSAYAPGTFGRKKKLERQLAENNLKENQHNLEISCSTKNLTKTRHHRSYSLIPHWKIRDHLMRLPFLRQHNKLKKSESCLTTSNRISSSGEEFPNPDCDSSLFQRGTTKGDSTCSNTSCKKIFNNKGFMAAVKTRSSSMDELRPTAEEHWYSADSDTEPDSLTLTPPTTLLPTIGEISKGSSLTLGVITSTTSTTDSNSTTKSASLNNNKNFNNENGSTRLGGHDIASIPDAPKAPKFRKGTGLKDKWRESWTQSKTLSKSNLEDENRLTRWFSLRKNPGQGSGVTDSANANHMNNRNSTLPLLSEEDLKRLTFMEDEKDYWPRRTVQPPTLPPPPADLSSDQITRRHILAAIVHSENNYVAALQRLVNEYKKPLEGSHPAMLSHSKISTVFHRLPEILQCHSLFRIALAEYIRKWDIDEKIGDVFVASFSKSLVLDVYSEFINNFGQAMETVKFEARRKSAFADFLKVKQMTAHDRLSLFGLMVKPVQRFPQFILLLQDLLKHTPKDHHDRMSLQLALTQLESLAAMLNERKRESEQYQAFRETIKSISGGKFVLLRSVADDPNRILLRQDIVTQLEFDLNGSTVAKSKSRKLLLLNDMLICVTVNQNVNSSNNSNNNSSNGHNYTSTLSSSTNGSAEATKGEKSVFKWSFPVRDVEVEDISISPTMSRIVGAGNSNTHGHHRRGTAGNIFQEDDPASNQNISKSLLEEMQCLMHDYEVLSRILKLVSGLKSSYEGLTESSVKELMLEIQQQIRCRDEQISFFDSSCLTLLLGTGNNREKVVYQMQSPAARNEWIEELRLAQLALDPNNSPAWDIPSESPYPHHKLPLFVRSLPLCRSPHLTTVKCGCFFTHTFVSPTGRSKILDYVWVSCTDGFSSHVTAYKSHQNALKEVSSFDMVEEKINDLLFVSGLVWVATESRKIMVLDPSDPEKGSVSQYLLSDSVLKLTLFESTIYAGLTDGNLAVFSQIQESKILRPECILKLGSERVPSVFGSREHVYAACGNSVVTINSKTFVIEKSVVLTHHSGPITQMACSGVGLWIATADSGTVCLYHLESLQHLQDVSIAPSVFRTVRDSYRRQKGCYVTCLTAHKGWLWIGTNLGVVLTIPLPRLEGVPIISTGKANVSYHGYYGPVTFLMPLLKTITPAITSSPTKAPTTTTISVQKSNSSSSSLSVENGDIIEEKTKSMPRGNVSFDENKRERDDIMKELLTPSPSNSSLKGNISSGGSGSPRQSGNDLTGSEQTLSASLNKTLVVLRKKNSRDNVYMRNCKTLPRGGQHPASNLRFSIDSDVYGLYGNLINVRGLEDEGRFVDPLYDALRRSDPELVALDSKISTLDRRLKMRMSRPRSLDLSNWSVDSKISASSDESVGLGGSRSSQATDITPTIMNDSPIPPVNANNTTVATPGATGTTKKTLGRTKGKGKTNPERTIVVVIGGRGYVNMKSNSLQDHFLNNPETDAKQCTHLSVWQMKT